MTIHPPSITLKAAIAIHRDAIAQLDKAISLPTRNDGALADEHVCSKLQVDIDDFGFGMDVPFWSHMRANEYRRSDIPAYL